MHAVGHVFLDELGVQVIHQGLDGARGVGTRNVAVQPALGVGNGRHRVAGATHRETVVGQGIDQRFNTGRVRHHVLDVGANREAHMAVGIFIGNVAQLADGEEVHLALGAGAHGPDLVATVRHMVQHTRTWPVVVFPVAIIFFHQRVQKRLVVRNAALNGGTHSCHGDLS